MKINFRNRLYVRLWGAVLLAVLVLALLAGWLLRTQAERIRAERLAEVPSREVMVRDASGNVVAQTTVRPVRVPGRGVEFQMILPEGVKGGEQIAISLPPRPRAGDDGRPDRRGGSGARPLEGGAFGGQFVVGTMLVLMALAVVLGSYPVVRGLTKRLEKLQAGMERFGAGEFRARVDDSGSDEVAFLAQRFNRAADQIEALVNSQKSLLANASHELRSPLARIRMAIELMEAAPSGALKEEISRNIAELDTLVDEILLASRLEASARGEGAPISMQEVDILALAAQEADRLKVPLDWSGQDAALAVRQGDAKLLRRMLRNLLENAQRYGGNDVQLEVRADTQAIELRVLDRGPGVELSERERIFEPFYRSNRASERSGGVGLGLALVRTIAQQHGGSVVCLEREGGGACFVVKLPRSAAPDAT